jgi:hypothetical protein
LVFLILPLVMEKKATFFFVKHCMHEQAAQEEMVCNP